HGTLRPHAHTRCLNISSEGKSRTIQTQLKPHSQASASDPLAQDAESAPVLDAATLKLELLSSLKVDIAGIIKKELQEVIGDALAPLRLEMQSVKLQIASDNAAIDAKLAKLTATLGDMEEALTGCTDDVTVMKTSVDRLIARVAMLENKCEDLESRSRRNNIRIIGVEEGPGSCSPTAVASLLKDAFSLDKEPLVDRSHRTLQPKPKPGDRPRAIVCRLHYHSDCVDILWRARELQRIKVGNVTLSVFPDYTAKIAWARLTGVIPGVVFCCCSPSASRFNMLCVQRCYSAYLGCNKWLFELLLPFYQLKPVCPFSSDLWHQQGICAHRYFVSLDFFFLIFGPFSVNPRDGCA
uniref:L1 transposable element RRM domain-containing protein n=1 Tax=Stegastes partitus TaxID=144197 RepID=A0A3B4ZJ67_9TELE